MINFEYFVKSSFWIEYNELKILEIETYFLWVLKHIRHWFLRLGFKAKTQLFFLCRVLMYF